jgi:hypothetical protein
MILVAEFEKTGIWAINELNHGCSRILTMALLKKFRGEQSNRIEFAKS